MGRSFPIEGGWKEDSSFLFRLMFRIGGLDEDASAGSPNLPYLLFNFEVLYQSSRIRVGVLSLS